MHPAAARRARCGLMLAACALAGSAGAQDAGNCDAIRAQIESKISASGVVGFRVLVVDADAHPAGQVVGSCALGTRKIVYERPRAPRTDDSAPPPPLRPTPMLTECKDGSTPVGGSCKP